MPIDPIEKPNADALETEIKKTKMEEFAKTAIAAKMSGVFHETAGRLKEKFGEITEDPLIQQAGREQQLLGKLHKLAGSVRGAHTAVKEKLTNSSQQSVAIFKKHGGRMIDVASDFVEDVKKTFLK